eukprot:14394423-Ditylum_brightwellii.AAC.3
MRVGKEVIQCSCGASWWELDDGSALVFWRWPKKFMKESRDGYPPFLIEENLPYLWRCTKLPKDASKVELLKKKIEKLVK